MTPKQADKLIKAGLPVTVVCAKTREIFTATFVSRDRRCIETSTGGKFHRDELEVVR